MSLRVAVIALLLLSTGCSRTRTVSVDRLPLLGGDPMMHTTYMGSDALYHYFGVQNGFDGYTARVPAKGVKIEPATRPFQPRNGGFIAKRIGDTIYLFTIDSPYAWKWHGKIKPLPASKLDQSLIAAGTPLVPPDELSFDGTPSREQAFAYLLNSNLVTGVAVGAEAKTPPTVDAFGVLNKQADRREIFEDLSCRGRAGGKIYGLMGLTLCDTVLADLNAKNLEKDAELVRMEIGCIVQTTTVGEMVRIGYVRDPLPNIYIEEYAQRWQPVATTQP
jgi:hypothetical protein